MPVIDTPQLVPTAPKSGQGHAAALSLYSDILQNPLGTQRGDMGGMPANYRVPPARIYVVNHSRTRAWKRVVVPVSEKRGAEEALIYDKALAKVYNVDTLIRQVQQGRDMSRYRTEVFPVAFRLRVPGGRDIVIPPAESTEAKPVAVEVPDGTWDMYLGNYDRMRGHSGTKDWNEEPFDQHVADDEKNRLATWWRQRHNPVFKYTDDGETTEINNDYGLLEFVRVTVQAVMEPIDKEYLSSLDVVEQ